MGYNTVKTRRYDLVFQLHACELDTQTCREMIASVEGVLASVTKLQTDKPEKSKCVYTVTIQCQSCRANHSINLVVKRAIHKVNGIEVINKRRHE